MITWQSCGAGWRHGKLQWITPATQLKTIPNFFLVYSGQHLMPKMDSSWKISLKTFLSHVKMGLIVSDVDVANLGVRMKFRGHEDAHAVYNYVAMYTRTYVCTRSISRSIVGMKREWNVTEQSMLELVWLSQERSTTHKWCEVCHRVLHGEITSYIQDWCLNMKAGSHRWLWEQRYDKGRNDIMGYMRAGTKVHDWCFAKPRSFWQTDDSLIKF